MSRSTRRWRAYYRAYNKKHKKMRRLISLRYRAKNKEKLRQYAREFYHKHKIKSARNSKANRLDKKGVIDSIKLSNSCMDCNINYEPCQMDFDHVAGYKKWAVGPSIARCLDTLIDEISKCQLVCSNCHRLRTYMRLPQ